MAGVLDHVLDKAWEDKPVGEVLKAPVAALEGISDRQAALLKDALGVKTIEDLGTNKFVLRAQAIVALNK